MPSPNQYKGTLIGSTIRPFSDQIKIATALSNEIKGGLHSVDSISDRNAIITERRQFGMIVYVVDDDTYYQLAEVVSPLVDNNSNWRSINIESDSSSPWRDNVIDYTGMQPGTPSIGDKYLISTALTYDWAGNDQKVAEYTSLGWRFVEPSNGFTLKVDDETGVLYIYEGDYPYGLWSTYNINAPIGATGIYSGLSGSRTVLSLNIIAGTGVSFSYVDSSLEINLNNYDIINPDPSGATDSLCVYDYNGGNIWYHATSSQNFTANFINVPTSSDYSYLTAKLIISQGLVGYSPTSVQINSVTQSVKWVNGTYSTSSNKIDVIDFSFIRTGGSWTQILGQIDSFS